MNPRQQSNKKLVTWQVLGLVVVLLVLRLAGIYNYYFFEEDEVSLAAGIAALVNNNIGDLYRYTPQLGYYRLIEMLTLVTGGNAGLIPTIMKTWSALMGVLVPVCALFMFRAELPVRIRWLSALVLAANPILWKSSQYGNSAMAALGLVCLAMVLLSNRPRKPLEILALVLFGIAVLVRADTIVLLPAAALLLWHNHRSIRPVTIHVVLFALGLSAVYAALYLLDPRLDDAVSTLSAHFSVERRTMFWEYLIWAISPIPLVLAITGFSRLLDTRAFILLFLLAWSLAPMALYFTATTTPRYFLLAVLPLAIATATGITDLTDRLGRWFRRGPVSIAILTLAFIHLFVGLGQFISSWRTSPLYGPSIRTDDGHMPTGALLYDTYLRGGFLAQSLRNPGFGKTRTPHWEGPVFDKALQILQDEAAADRTTIILLDTGYGHAFHFHAQVAGANYISRAPSAPSVPFASETWLELGTARVMTVAVWSGHHDALAQYPVAAGDQVWVMGDTEFPGEVAREKLPPGLDFMPAGTIDERIRVFDIYRQ